MHVAVDMGDSEGNLDFMLFLDNYVPEIKRTSVKKCFFKKETHKEYCEWDMSKDIMKVF